MQKECLRKVCVYSSVSITGIQCVKENSIQNQLAKILLAGYDKLQEETYVPLINKR